MKLIRMFFVINVVMAMYVWPIQDEPTPNLTYNVLQNILIFIKM